MKNIDKKTIYIGLGFLVAGLLLGWIFFGGETKSSGQREEEALAEHKHEAGTTWTCSMHPQIRKEEPGQCPICGMDLIPVSNMEAETVAADEIQMSEAAVSIANVQTVTVQKAVPGKELYLPGKVQADERRIADITSRFGGRIEKLYVNFTGQQVKRGQKLASIYSPQLVTAQKELFEAAKFKETNPSFYEAAVNKLKLWDLTDTQIQNILEKKEVQYYFNVLSPQSGTVVSRNVSQGDYVKEGESLFEVANLDKVWVQFDAYENDLSWIEEGDKISFTVQSMPGKTFTSKITFIDPVINPQTRVASVRTEVDNPKDQLKPAMFAQGILQASLEGANDALVIPKTAVLWTGKRAVVYVKKTDVAQPTFAYRQVVLGPEAGDQYVVMEGLEEGEEIVANGVFKIDAASQLQGKVSMMNPEGGNTGGSMPGMAGMDMGEASSVEGKQVPTAEFIEGDAVDFREQIPDAFRAQLDQVINAYLELKEGLVEADENATQKYSSALLEALNEVDGDVLEGTAKDFWQEKADFLKQHARLCKEASSIAGKRENFIYLSQALIKVVEAFGVSQQPLYVDFCPMADDNKGAYWLSEVKEIRNPFFGEAMLTCGEVRDEL